QIHYENSYFILLCLIIIVKHLSIQLQPAASMNLSIALPENTEILELIFHSKYLCISLLLGEIIYSMKN
ncbi:MAG: hypothetical protein QW563_07270, partial [Candidatus Methanomethylicia archaeon]